MRNEVVRNDRLFAWFDDGKLCDAIIGSAKHFIPAVTKREVHDRMLVISQMALWGHARGREEAVGRAVEEAIKLSARRDDIRSAFDIAWTFLLISEEEARGVPIDRKAIAQTLQAVLQRNQDEIDNDNELATLVSSVQARLPGVSTRSSSKTR